MDPKGLAKAADLATLGAYLAELPRIQHEHGGQTAGIREDDYRGHRIVIKTTYEITVDGAPLHIPLRVTNDGQIHCHSLPTYQFLSAVELIRRIIDHFPDDFPTNRQSSKPKLTRSRRPRGQKQGGK